MASALRSKVPSGADLFARFGRAHIEELLIRRGKAPKNLAFEYEPLLGGLEGATVLLVKTRYDDGASGRRRLFSCVVKILDGMRVREADVYERLLNPHVPGFAPRVFAVHRLSSGHAIMYLEAVHRVRSWPWRSFDASRLVVERLASLHLSTAAIASELPGWDYELELESSANATLDALEQARSDPDLASTAAAAAPAVRRMVAALPKLRARLLAFSALKSGPVHGDVHPGNVLLRRRRAHIEPVFIDWARARIGSPLEDLSSWLQSLGYWEPEARRRHDTLLAAYLSARGMDPRLRRDLRVMYWAAGACNAFAGALRYHLWAALEGREAWDRTAALHSVRDWLRVVRRADAHMPL